MTDCSNIPTLTLVEESKKAMEDIKTVVKSSQTTYESELTGETGYTLTGLNQLFGGINVGGYVNDTVLNEVWEYAYYSATGYGYKVKSKSSLPYAINTSLYPDPEGDPNLKRVSDVNHEDVTKAQEELLGVGSQIYPRSGYLANGMNVTAGTTHLRVLVDGNPVIVLMSKEISGVVSGISDSSATIAGVLVKFKRPLTDIPSVYDIFIIYGQSNAVGYALNTPNYPEESSYALFWNYQTQSISPIQKDLRYSSGDVSSGHAWTAFANEYIKRTGRGVIFVPCAKGGTAISGLEKPSTEYTNLTNEMTALDAYVLANSFPVSGKRSLLWCQGETDMLNGTDDQVYQTSLDNLYRDIRTDFNVDKCYQFLVGCPQDQSEKSWMRIRNRQDFLAQSYDWVINAFTGLGSFTTGNGLLRDGVHATQNGYNYMGTEGAKSAAASIDLINPASKPEEDQYGGLLTTPDQIWRHVRARVACVSASYSLLDQLNASQIFRSCNVEDISVDTQKVRILLNTFGNWNLSSQIDVNTNAERLGLSARAEYVLLNSFQAAVDVYFYMDLQFALDTVGGVFAPTNLGALPNYLANSITSTPDGSGNVDVTWPNSKFWPSLDVFGAVASGPSITNTSETGAKVRFDGAANVIVTVKKALMNPNNLPDFQFDFQAIMCDKKE